MRKERLHARRDLEQAIAVKQRRKVAARRAGERSVWFGLGMFGLIGWAVTIPSLIGVALGLWIDSRWPSQFSWALMLLVGGVAVGCLNAWWWIQREAFESDESASRAKGGDDG